MNGTREKIFRILLNKSKDKSKGELLEKILSKIFHFYCLYILGFEFEAKTHVGNNLSIVHGARGSVVNSDTVIGNNCVIRNNTIIGNNGLRGGSPTIGNNVNIGSNTCIIGEIMIGDNVVIGASSVVVKDVPSNVVIAGNPARIIRSTDKGNGEKDRTKK